MGDVTAGDQIQAFPYAKQVLHHWAISQGFRYAFL